jgi:hypothetical protein
MVSDTTPPRLPNLLIAGVGKAGTTSLFHYLSQHPQICASAVKEPRYFRLPDDEQLGPIEGYARLFAHCGTQRYVMEASPQYFKGGARSVELIRTTLECPRVILMFRDPVSRMWSEYRFKKSRLTIPAELTFDDYVARCEKVREAREPRTRENEVYYWLAGGAYVDHVGVWFDGFGDDLAVWFFEHLVQDSPGFVAQACRWLGIDDALVASFNYSIENKTEEVRSRTLQRLALSANKEGGAFRNRRSLKAPLRRAYYLLNRQPNREQMSSETRSHLQEIFSASNAALALELERRGRGEDLPAWLRANEEHPEG